jgi:hypothetical protein
MPQDSNKPCYKKNVEFVSKRNGETKNMSRFVYSLVSKHFFAVEKVQNYKRSKA